MCDAWSDIDPAPMLAHQQTRQTLKLLQSSPMRFNHDHLAYVIYVVENFFCMKSSLDPSRGLVRDRFLISAQPTRDEVVTVLACYTPWTKWPHPRLLGA